MMMTRMMTVVTYDGINNYCLTRPIFKYFTPNEVCRMCFNKKSHLGVPKYGVSIYRFHDHDQHARGGVRVHVHARVGGDVHGMPGGYVHDQCLHAHVRLRVYDHGRSALLTLLEYDLQEVHHARPEYVLQVEFHVREEHDELGDRQGHDESL